MRLIAPALFALAALPACVAPDGTDHDHADLAALQTRLNSLSADLDAAQETIASQSATLLSLQEELAAVTGGVDVTDLADQVADHETRIGTLEAEGATTAAMEAADAALAESIATNALGVAANADGVTQNADDIAQLTADLAAGAAAVGANAAAIAQNSADIGANAASISSNSALISANSGSIATNTSAIAQNAADIAANAADIATNAAAVTNLQGDVAGHTSAIAANTTAVGTNTTNIAANSSNIGSNTTAIGANATAIAANGAAIAALQTQSLAGTVNNPAASCLALITAQPGLPDGPYWLLGDSGVPYQAWCDMTTNGGGWTLLGTVYGGDRNMWNTEERLWSNDQTLGSADSPFADHKSAAWYDLDVSSAEVLFERRYDGAAMAQTVIGNACLTDATTGSTASYFSDLFVDWNDFQTPCANSNITVLTPANDATGLYDATYQEGSGANAIGGSGANGFCWNGGDTNSNTFRGHAGWNQSAYGTSCYAPGHLGYIGVFTNGSSQYSNRDIDTTNWLYGTDVTLTGVSLYAR